ncbi:Crp/Fnr family transcriptional regulator [Winogradskyella sp.]|uniref:Crp/Fnr family transcriptional regulator n=1 Tax=Winogradskyella sp. TaxID=1883156 RepID=UPI00260DBE71|nr:Crp/Fnr family transcriptional regulator [Winogradskyella sp.]
MHQRAIKKGEIIQRSGELNSKIYHVHEGLLRGYSIDEKGKEHIFIFAPEGWTIADNQSPEAPCDLFIDALEDSIVTVHEKDISKEHQNVKPLVKRLAVLQKRIIMLMSYSAKERYAHFLETYPNIIQRVPQKMIASYLGITPEALSTLKRKLIKK